MGLTAAEERERNRQKNKQLAEKYGTRPPSTPKIDVESGGIKLNKPSNSNTNKGYDPDSRGSKLYEQKFQETYGQSQDNFFAQTDAAKAAGKYDLVKDIYSGTAPKYSENLSPEQNKINLLTWERNQARQAHLAAVELTKTTQGLAEKQKEQESENFFKKQSGSMQKRSGEKINPEYQKLTEEEKKYNEYIYQKTGKYRVNPTVSAWSGRMPQRNLNRDEKMRLYGNNFNQSNISTEKTTNTPFAQNKGASGATGIQKELEELKNKWGLDDNQDLDLITKKNPDGTIEYELEIKDNQEIEDAIERSKENWESDKNKAIRNINEYYDNRIAQISSKTEQGRRQIAKLKRDKKEKIEEKERQFEESREYYYQKELRRDQTFDKIQKDAEKEVQNRVNAIEENVIVSSNSDIIKNYNQLLKQNRINMVNEEIKNNPNLNFLEADRVVQSKLKKIGGEEKIDLFQNFNSLLKGNLIDPKDAVNVFSAAAETTAGNSKEAKKLVAAKFGDVYAKEAEKEYVTEVLGVDGELYQKERDIHEMVFAKLRGEELTMEELDQIDVYEAKYPEQALRLKLKIENPEMSNEEIYKTAKNILRPPKQPKEKTPTKTSIKNQVWLNTFNEKLQETGDEIEALKFADLSQKSTKTAKTTKTKNTRPIRSAINAAKTKNKEEEPEGEFIDGVFYTKRALEERGLIPETKNYEEMTDEELLNLPDEEFNKLLELYK